MNDPISKEVVIALHDRTIERFGGAAGVRDEGLLEAAIAQSWQTFDGIDLYPSIEEKAARLCYEAVAQHPFVDGNKRTGALLVGVLLRKNEIKFKPFSKDYLNIIAGLASGENEYAHLLEFIRTSS